MKHTVCLPSLHPRGMLFHENTQIEFLRWFRNLVNVRMHSRDFLTNFPRKQEPQIGEWIRRRHCCPFTLAEAWLKGHSRPKKRKHVKAPATPSVKNIRRESQCWRRIFLSPQERFSGGAHLSPFPCSNETRDKRGRSNIHLYTNDYFHSSDRFNWEEMMYATKTKLLVATQRNR